MSKNRMKKQSNLRGKSTKPELIGYYFDGEKSYKIYDKDGRSYRVQDK